ATYNMDWIVGLDYGGIVDEVLNYGSGFIPTMYLINETGHVIYSEVGFDETTVRATLSSLLPDDTTFPSFSEINFYNNSELSIFNPRFEVFANISEDRNLKNVEVRIINDGIEKYSVTVNKINGFYIIDQGISIDPLFLYPLTNLEIQIYVRDYFNNGNLTGIYYLPITQYFDSGPPVISNTAVEWYEVSETKYNVTVFATIEEDLLFSKKDVWFMEGATIKKAATFMEFNATHMVASAELLYSQAMPWEIFAHLVIRDAAGNEVTVDLDIAEAPEPTETPTPSQTDESNFVLLLPLLSFLAVIAGVQILRKRK
ncbi:MAG: TlpA family protein disulfide reductase, partial [Candidatus Heimdallarchaeaceae archaeon]